MLGQLVLPKLAGRCDITMFGGLAQNLFGCCRQRYGYRSYGKMMSLFRRERCSGHSLNLGQNLIPSRSALTHADEQGKASMVDVSGKASTRREATAEATVSLQENAFNLVKENQIKKGDVLSVAMLAGIMGAKECHRLIPLCHNISLSKVAVNLSLDDLSRSVKITGTAISFGQTGVEMEALTAVSVAALTVYDMCKAVTQDIVIGDVRLIEKKGGKSGHYLREPLDP